MAKSYFYGSLSFPSEKDNTYWKWTLPGRICCKDHGKTIEAVLLAQFGELMSKTDSFNPLTFSGEGEINFQGDIFQSVWKEANTLRQSGDLLRLAQKVSCPVVAIHGDYAPHPSAGVEKPLSLILADFRFILLKKGGHKPWLEKTAKEEFYQILKEVIN